MISIWGPTGYVTHIYDQYNFARMAHCIDVVVERAWWLRCPGHHINTSVMVWSDGSVFITGNNKFGNEHGVRPAMWLSFDVISTQVP